MHLSWDWSLDVLTADGRPYAGSRWQLLEKPICSGAFKFRTIHSSSWRHLRATIQILHASLWISYWH